VRTGPVAATADLAAPAGPTRSPGRPRDGHVLMIVGPDGTGKTTLCKAVEQAISGQAPVRVLANRRGAEPLGILPARAPRGSTLAPHRHPAHPPLLSLAKVLYSFVNFYLIWLVKIRPFVRRGGWVVVERGWWDMLVDPLRYRLRLPRPLGRAIAYLMPRPSLVLVLEAPAEVIAARKAQLSVPELVRQMRAWREILPPKQRRLYLDTSAPIEDVVQRISHAISDLLELPGDRQPTRWKRAV
jgi:thymidylate kinase